MTEQRYPTMAQTASNAHKLIDALATGRITGELAHAYLSADLQEDQLDAILKAHTKPAPTQQPAHTFPSGLKPTNPLTKFGTADWQVTCYPGQPLPTQRSTTGTLDTRPRKPGQILPPRQQTR